MQDQIFVVDVSSLHDLIKCTTDLERHLRRKLIYRGHARESYQLIPSLMRHPQLDKRATTDLIDEYEQKLLREFKKLTLPHISHLKSGPSEYLDWLALAQHHRLPTRLLDWTYSPLVAMFFVAHNKPTADSESGCIWAIIPPHDIDITRIRFSNQITGLMLYNPSHVTPRITAQHGCFTVHPSHYLSRSSSLEIPGQTTIFRISAEFLPSILNDLYTIGVSKATLFPDLDGIAEHLRETIAP